MAGVTYAHTSQERRRAAVPYLLDALPHVLQEALVLPFVLLLEGGTKTVWSTRASMRTRSDGRATPNKTNRIHSSISDSPYRLLALAALGLARRHLLARICHHAHVVHVLQSASIYVVWCDGESTNYNLSRKAKETNERTLSKEARMSSSPLSPFTSSPAGRPSSRGAMCSGSCPRTRGKPMVLHCVSRSRLL